VGGITYRTSSSPAAPVRPTPTVTTTAVSRRSVDRAAAPRPRVVQLVIARPWIARLGPTAQRQTILLFRLSRSAMVELTFIRIAPDCRVVGRLRVGGHAGLNRMRFRGRIGRRVLSPGTYRVTARTLRPRGARQMQVRLVIVGEPNPPPGMIAAARAANACAAGPRDQESATVAAAGPTTGGPDRVAPESKPIFTRAVGVLGARFTRAVELVQAVPPFLFVILALAIALLALAATPLRATPSLRLRKLLAYHRELVALAGTVAVIGVTITYVIW
jgi:hypothetical protein